MTPKGKEPTETRPLPVRLFEARINKLFVSQKKKEAAIVQKIINTIR